MAIIFNQASVFHLYRLGTLVYGKTGTRYTLSDEGERLELIRFCNSYPDKSVQRQLSAFIDSLDAGVISQLQSMNLIGSNHVSWSRQSVAV